MQRKKGHRLLNAVESGLLLVIWIVLFSIPVFLQWQNGTISWEAILPLWGLTGIFFMLNLFNHFVLVPYCFFKRTKRLYSLSAIVTAILFVWTLNSVIPEQLARIAPPGPPPHGIPPPHHPFWEMDPPPPDFIHSHGMAPPDRPPDDFFNPGHIHPHNPKVFYAFLITLLILGSDTALRIIFRWTRIEKERELLEKEKIKSELAFLRNQVSPHFFMNTMNNIHALIAIDPRKAQNSVMQLSKMMSYLLYNTNEGYTKLSQEIEFIKSYTKLMKLRYSSKVAINLNFPDEIPEVNIPPLLFTALVENAFKHGVSYISESFVDLVMQIDNHQLYFMLRNSKTRNIKGTHQPGGLGLENLKKRLELLFQEQYELIISEDQNTFEITIKIPLYA